MDGKLVAKVNNIDTSGSALWTKYDRYESDSEKKVADTSGLIKSLVYIAKIADMENKIPSITGLATNTALIAVENKIPNISSLAK